MKQTVFHSRTWDVSGEKRFSTKQVQTALGIGHRNTFILDRSQFGWQKQRSLTLEQAKKLWRMRRFMNCGGNHPHYSRANFNRLEAGDSVVIQGQEFNSLEALFQFKKIDWEQEFQDFVEVLNGSC